MHTKIIGAVGALGLMAGSAAAVTVENKSDAAIKIGVDYGAKEEVKDVAPNKSVKFDCNDGCGVTGPWSFSWMAKGDDTISTDGTSLVTVQVKEG